MPIPPIPTKCTCLMRLNMMQDHYVFPSSQRRGGCAERSKGADGVVSSAEIFRRSDHPVRSEEHTSELQSQSNLVCRLLLEKKKKKEQKHNNNQRHTI